MNKLQKVRSNTQGMGASLQAVESLPFLRLGMDTELRKVLGQGILLPLLGVCYLYCYRTLGPQIGIRVPLH